MVFYDKTRDLLMLQCKNSSWVTIDRVSMPGKRKMSAADFNNGFIKNRREKVIIFGEESEIEVKETICKKM